MYLTRFVDYTLAGFVLSWYHVITPLIFLCDQALGADMHRCFFFCLFIEHIEQNCTIKTIDMAFEKADNILVLVALQIAHITNTYIQSSKQRVDLTIYPFYFYIY